MGNTQKPGVQGEGDYDAARRYDKDVHDFVKSADIDKAAHDAAPHSPDEQREMTDAEQAGRRRSKAGKEKDMSLEPESKKTGQ